jgi:predicted Zn-dependent protease
MSAEPGQTVDPRQEYRRASRRWQDALLASAEAPPDAGFAQRVRDIATAANQQSGAFNLLAATALNWRPRPSAQAMELSYELRPGARSRPGPPDLWDRFDRAVESLGDAYEGVSLAEIGHAFGRVAKAAHEIADALEEIGYGRGRQAARVP